MGSLPAVSRPWAPVSLPPRTGVSISSPEQDLDTLAPRGNTAMPTEEPKRKSGSSIVLSILPRGPLCTGKIKGSVQPLPSCPQVQGTIHLFAVLWKYHQSSYQRSLSSSATRSSRSLIRSDTGSASSSLSMYFSCQFPNFTLLFSTALCSSSMCFLRSL